MKRNRTSITGRRKGAAIAEFGAAFLVLVVFFFVPLINMSFLGVKFFIAQGAIQEFAHRLALAEKRSDSYALLGSDSWWSEFCKNCGVQISQSKLSLLICAAENGERLALEPGQAVPSEWLPGGSKAPCIYTYDLAVDVMIPPVFNGGGPAIPGLTAPIPFTLNGRSAWENLSRNPATQEYFINE